MTTTPTSPLAEARRNDSQRRRRQVLDALDRLRTNGDEISVSAVARTAGVDRSFLYRHHDLRSQILALAAEPEPHPASTGISRRSLLADLANLRTQQTPAPPERQDHRAIVRSPRRKGFSRRRPDPHRRNRHSPEPRGRARTTALDCRQDLQDRGDELAAARAANRDLITTLSTAGHANRTAASLVVLEESRERALNAIRFDAALAGNGSCELLLVV